jgi:hypothetical protein
MVRQPDGQVEHILLVAPNGGPAGDHYAGLVGRPVQVAGELYQDGDLQVLRVEQLTGE